MQISHYTYGLVTLEHVRLLLEYVEHNAKQSYALLLAEFALSCQVSLYELPVYLCVTLGIEQLISGRPVDGWRARLDLSVVERIWQIKLLFRT